MSRRRSMNIAGGRPGRHEVTTSAEEEAELLMAAAQQGGHGVTVARFLRESALAVARAEDAAGVVETPTARRARMAELFALRHSLAEMAVEAKRVGVNVNQVARGVHTGQPVPVEEMRGYLADEREFLAQSRGIAERIDGLIDELQRQGVEA